MRYFKVCLLIVLVFSFHNARCETMEMYVFPEEVQVQFVSDAEAKSEYRVPENLSFKVNETPTFSGTKSMIRLELTNHGPGFNLIVNPVGGDFPNGGTNPFHIHFASTAVTYIGPSYPPEPPLPMRIVIPAHSKIVFWGEIPLDEYSWRRAPFVAIKWAFCFLKEPYPEGSITVQLPEEKVSNEY